MKFPGILLLSLLLSGILTPHGFASPVLVGLSNKHPLTQTQIGELLIGELRCLSCHTRKGAQAALEKLAPDLSDVGFRVAPDHIRQLISNPSKAHSGTLMPDLLTGVGVDQRNRISEAITHFLVAQSVRKFQTEPIKSSIEALSGKALFHSVGCVACHSPRDEKGQEPTKEGVVHLDHVSGKYSLSSLSEFLFQPTKARPSGRMPDMKLNAVEARQVASYLLENTQGISPGLQPKEDLVALGKKYFQQFQCVACHKLADVPGTVAPIDLDKANIKEGCLSSNSAKAPRYLLSEEQTRAIQLALSKPAEASNDKVRLATTLVAFNCIACHIRDDFGGVQTDRSPFFKTSANNLGEEGRIPPPLTLVGAKLQPVWLKKVLFDQESVRPYMSTRMPQYGEPNLRHLPELFTRLDHLEDFHFNLPNSESPDEAERKRANFMRDAGRELLGDKSLYCVACHNFNGKTPQNHGIELMTSHQRLQPAWFNQYLRNPGAFRPRTVMPSSWPGGKAAQTSVLDGNTDKQIEAIWYFLSLGSSAPDPSGVRPKESKLLVNDATRTYRGRSSVAGYRGIAVGFPNRLNYAFNAETGTLSAIWHGDFIRVDRSGQGSGGFNPASRFVGLAQDLSIFDLGKESTPWPLRPVMTKEKPENPDPLYPKNRGYQFKGYYLDPGSIPTLIYKSGDVEIEDRSVPESAGEKSRLTRELIFQSPRDQTLWFRALTGKVEDQSARQFKNGELMLTVPLGQTVLRPNSEEGKGSELLIKWDIPKGKSKQTLSYELLK